MASATTQKRSAKQAATAPVRASKKAAARANRHVWAHAGVALCVITSGLLNGYGNAMDAPTRGVSCAAWALGIMIPILVLILAKIAGMQYRSRVMMGRVMLAYVTAIIGAFLLGLSVYHCMISIADVTKCGWVLALPMAVAIDCGLVACELDLVIG